MRHSLLLILMLGILIACADSDAQVAEPEQEVQMGWPTTCGTGIRNEFGLWGGNFAFIKSCSGKRNAHPDHVSMIIIERLWDSLQ